MPWAKCRKSTERTVDFYLTECRHDDAPAIGPGETGGGDRSLSALYDGMTRAQLVDVASVEGVDVPPRATKAEIVSLLEAAR